MSQPQKSPFALVRPGTQEYTDGVSDALDVDLEASTPVELARMAMNSRLKTPAAIAAALVQPAAKKPQADDATVFVLKVDYSKPSEDHSRRL